MDEQLILPSHPGESRAMRLDSAAMFKRFFHLERAIVVTAAGWVPAVRRLDSKALLARLAWESAMTADAQRTRVMELRYPDTSMELGDDAALVRVFEASLHAPSGAAVLRALAGTLIPALTAAYEDYLSRSDPVADGPSHRFLKMAVAEKRQQQHDLAAAAAAETSLDPHGADPWPQELDRWIQRLGGVRPEPPASEPPPPVLEGGRPFALLESPLRDERYHIMPFYWPDNIDASYPYGQGLRLQLRAAVSHLNEVWAVETAGAILQGLSGDLGWDFVRDAARWLYDESRHMTMGMRRLEHWGLDRSLVPLGSYIYDSCRGQDILCRLGMLAYFETKNIAKKKRRTAEFDRLGDTASAADMDFDWADEAMHAGFGRRWMRKALQARGRSPDDWPQLVDACEELVRARVAAATDEAKDAVRRCADALVEAAEQRAATATGGGR